MSCRCVSDYLTMSSRLLDDFLGMSCVYVCVWVGVVGWWVYDLSLPDVVHIKCTKHNTSNMPEVEAL